MTASGGVHKSYKSYSTASLKAPCHNSLTKENNSRYPDTNLQLKLGPATVRISPRLCVTSGSCNLPFVAYNDPEHQRAQRDLYSRERQRQKSVEPEDNLLEIEPFDVATMLAMAQMQASLMPGAAFYKVSLYVSCHLFLG